MKKDKTKIRQRRRKCRHCHELYKPDPRARKNRSIVLPLNVVKPVRRQAGGDGTINQRTATIAKDIIKLPGDRSGDVKILGTGKMGAKRKLRY